MTTGPLVDTNVLLRFADSGALDHPLAVKAVSQLLAAGSPPRVTAQNIIEFWAVATRPRDVNGFGWDTSSTQAATTRILSDFVFVEDSAEGFTNWQRLVRLYGVAGKRCLDARLVAVMVANGLTRLLTFNTDDFKVFGEIAVSPDELAAD